MIPTSIKKTTALKMDLADLVKSCSRLNLNWNWYSQLKVKIKFLLDLKYSQLYLDRAKYSFNCSNVFTLTCKNHGSVRDFNPEPAASLAEIIHQRTNGPTDQRTNGPVKGNEWIWNNFFRLKFEISTQLYHGGAVTRPTVIVNIKWVVTFNWL